MKVSKWFVAAALALGTITQAGHVEPFKDGDRVCFIGDSITHVGRYHSYVYLYYLTRFPDREIRVLNKGIAGDTAKGVLQRFDTDIAVDKPTVSTVMLGMNDIAKHIHGKNKTDSKKEKKKQQRLDQYYENMKMLIGRIQAVNSELILITPSIYDQTAELKEKNFYGANDALGKCAEFVKSTSAALDRGYVDFYDSMSTINALIQASDKSATIAGKDRVHPADELGHFIMAYQFLKAQNVPQYVSKIELNASSSTVAEAINCSVTNIKSGSSGLSFTALESALPFPQPAAISNALELVPFTRDFNQEILAVKRLDAGNYSLSIDGVTVGSYSAEDFAMGINLAINENTPQYQQSLKVKKLNDKRRVLQVKLRDAAYVYYNHGLFRAQIDVTNESAVKAFITAKLKSNPRGYQRTKLENYWGVKLEEKNIRAELNTIHTELYKANRAVPHTYSIEAVK